MSERSRKGLLYVAMSAFIVWHALALIVGPAPRESAISSALRPLVNPYLDLLYLNIEWGFFAPVGMTSEFFYRVEGGDGKVHEFRPTRGLPWYLPRALWVRDRFRTIATFPEEYGDRLIAELCARHKALSPRTVSLVETAQTRPVTPADHRAGKAALDPEFSETHVLRAKPCSGK